MLPAGTTNSRFQTKNVQAFGGDTDVVIQLCVPRRLPPSKNVTFENKNRHDYENENIRLAAVRFPAARHVV
jgi:hypothetical protein